MGFTNLYTKSTANPKDIDFAAVGARVKNKIPDMAINAFRAKVPGPQAKPFEFKFDKDYDTGKLQITVKPVGLVFGWVDEVFVANKLKMKVVETEIDGWKARVELSMQSVEKHREGLEPLVKKLETMEGAVTSNQVDAEMLKELGVVKQGLEQLDREVRGEHATTMQFLDGGPKQGVMGLIKKHGLPVDQIGGEKKEADGNFARLLQQVKKFQDQCTALLQEIVTENKRSDVVYENLLMKQNASLKRGNQLEDLELAIQKDIGAFQGDRNSDFAAVGAKTLLKEAKEFMGKSGETWAKLSGNPGEIDKKIAQVKGVFESMRIRGSGIVQQYQAWQRPTIPQGEYAEVSADAENGV